MDFRNPFASNGIKPSTTPIIVSLAEDILHWAHIIADHFSDNNLPQPSFALDGPDDYPTNLPINVQDARIQLRAATSFLAALAAGPKANIMWTVWNYHDISTLMYINHFRIADAVPLTGSISFADVAAATKTPESQLKRILRYAALNHIFAEPEPGRVAHTPASRQLVTSQHVQSWIGVRTEETGPASFSLVAATEKWGGDAMEREQTPYSLAHCDGKLSRFDYLALPGNQHREARFANLMRALQATEGYKLDYTVQGYNWQDLGDGATVVDVGGSMGATAQAIAQATNLNFIVQDLPGVVAKGREALPAEFASRIEFMPYDFFESTQPVPDAAAYVFRQIFHDWTDKYAARALRNTASILRAGQKLIIVDVVMPPPGSVNAHIETQLRRSDMEMMVQFNALEREAADWEALIKMADERLEVTSISKPPGSHNSIVEVVVGAGGLAKTVEKKPSLTYGRRGSLLYADTSEMGPSRRDSLTYVNTVGAA
ncbi:O-methyltransferase-domain-containing protein [Neohortaea acidophila]|uniref:O-methyltransferase-domain-containing protein n=1 Tax=Neohortaea acidophila TaxID=245834 RepID=A0A6A6PZ68_9PEZI|nr:O-methyltransferase-domain-containing protein [Neohortaea acidophila]KAF2484753.1 O-methyltransferase-domain-containing protein [Neohortaea acidophila]